MSLATALEALKRSDFETARRLIVDLTPDQLQIPHFLVKGLAELALEQWEAAAQTFSSAVIKFPDHAVFWLNLGVAQENLGQWDEAIESHTRCLELDRSQGDAFGNLSNLLRKKRRFAASEDAARKALAAGASKSNALNSLSLALSMQGKFKEAEQALADAAACDQTNPLTPFNQANLAVDQRKFSDAWAFFAAARRLKDDPAFRREEGLARLLAGDLATGFALFEARLDMKAALRLRPDCPRWQGENMTGKKLLILAEQGLGDVLHFCQWAQYLIGIDLVWAVPANLIRVLKNFVHGEIVDENAPLPICAFYIPIMSLPFVTRHYDVLPRRAPYVNEGAIKLPFADEPLKIGLVWTGSSSHARDHERSIDLACLRPLLEKIEGHYYALSIGQTLHEFKDFAITPLADRITDFADTASLLSQLDVLVTVDTAVAHLAGLVGIKTFLLLPFIPDWRWGIESDHVAMYPSLTLLRQATYGDWNPVIGKLINLLERGFRKAT